jgi:hypothetical protein
MHKVKAPLLFVFVLDTTGAGALVPTACLLQRRRLTATL